MRCCLINADWTYFFTIFCKTIMTTESMCTSYHFTRKKGAWLLLNALPNNQLHTEQWGVYCASFIAMFRSFAQRFKWWITVNCSLMNPGCFGKCGWRAVGIHIMLLQISSLHSSQKNWNIKTKVSPMIHALCVLWLAKRHFSGQSDVKQ